MNWEILEAVSVFVASVATVITLIYLAIQMHESNRLARAAALKSVIDGFLEHTVKPSIENPQTIDLNKRGHFSYLDLTASEKNVFETIIVREALHLHNAMLQYQHGLIDDIDYMAWQAQFVPYILSPGGKMAWEKVKSTITPTVVAAAEKYIAENPNTISWDEKWDRQLNEQGL